MTAANNTAPGSSAFFARHLRDAEVATLIRVELKAAFPTVKFSVRSRHSVTIRYTDGPTPDRVEAIVNPFQGKTFNSSDDSTHYRPAFLHNGEWVETCCYVHVTRELSDTFAARIAAAVATYYDMTAPSMVEGWVKPTREQDAECQLRTGADWGTLIYRASRDRSQVCRVHREAEYDAFQLMEG